MKQLIVMMGLLGLQGMANAQMIRKSIYFEPAVFTLNQTHRYQLDSLLKVHQANEYQIIIQGYADSVGNVESNLLLSEKRTQSVSEYLKKNIGTKASITCRSFGESRSTTYHSDKAQSQWNRRVDVWIKPVKIATTVSVTPPDKKDYNQWPYVRTTEQGTIIRLTDCSFSPHKPEDVVIKVDEMLNKQDMFTAGTTTIDAKGNCLISGGMIYVNCYVNGKPVQPNKDCGIEISMPTPSFDPEMKLYTSQNSCNPNAQWSETNTTPKQTKANGRTYYTFKSSRAGGINMDKPYKVKPPVPNPKTIITAIKNSLAHPPTTIKIKGLEKYFVNEQPEILITFNNQNTLVKARRVRKNTYRIQCNCLEEQMANAIVLIKFKEREYMLTASFTTRDYKKVRNLSVFESTDFKSTGDGLLAGILRQ